MLAQRLKSELRSKEQEAQLSSAVEVLEPVGVKLIHEVAGHAALERRLRETMTGKEAAQLEASKSSVPVSRKSGDVQEHADHVTHWVNGKVPGTAAVAYLESAPDGGSLGKLIFKDIADDQKVVKEVEAIAKRFISWDNSKCLHSFKAHYQGTRRLLGPLALTSYGDMVKVGIITQPTTTTRPPKSRKHRRATTVVGRRSGGPGRRATQAIRSRHPTLFRTARRTPYILCRLTRMAATKSYEPAKAV